jgi:NADH pyrophosphatase NudC (nudix superfamily)
METYLEKNFRYCPKCAAKLELKTSFAVCLECQFIHYINPAPCTVALFTQQESVLLARRAIEPRKGYWDVVGGFIENGETAEESVIREAKEETNLDAEISSYLGSFPDIYGNTLLPTLIFIYHLKAKENDFSVLQAQDDVAELKWFQWDQLPTEFAFANVKPALDMLKKSLEKK